MFFSRAWAVKRFFDHLPRVKIPWNLSELIILIDGSPRLQQQVEETFQQTGIRPLDISVYTTGNESLGEMSEKRRQRIVNNWQMILPSINGQVILGMEDDTLPQPNAYTRLLDVFTVSGAAFVQASIVGRWNIRMVTHWKCSFDENGKSLQILSGRPPAPDEPKIVPIQGGGWYCFVARADVFKQVGVRMPDENCPLGPDVQQIMDMVAAGYTALGCWDVWCDHFTQGQTVRPDNGRGIETRDFIRLSAESPWKTVPRRKLGMYPGAPNMGTVRKKSKMSPQETNGFTEKGLTLGTSKTSSGGPMKIATCEAKTTIMIGGNRFFKPPRGGQFEMLDLGRVRTLERRGKLKVVKIEDYDEKIHGKPFDGARVAGTKTEPHKAKSLPLRPPAPQKPSAAVSTAAWSPDVVRSHQVKATEPEPVVEALEEDEDPEEVFPDDDDLKADTIDPALPRLLRALKADTVEVDEEPEEEVDPEVPPGGMRCPRPGCGKILGRASGLAMHLKWHERQDEMKRKK